MRPIIGILALILALESPRTASANESIRQALNQLAGDILASIPQGTTVKIGSFKYTSVDGLPNVEAGIVLVLTQELERLRKGVVQENATFLLKGEIVFPKIEPRQIRIDMKIVDSATELPVNGVQVKAFYLPADNKVIAGLLQPTFFIGNNPDESKQERQKKIEKAILAPVVHIHGEHQTLISSDEKSPFSIEIRVKPNAMEKAKARRATAGDLKNNDGKVVGKGAFVDIELNELYEVVVYNNSGRVVAVALTIDGVDQFHFCRERNEKTGAPLFSHWIMVDDAKKNTPQKELLIPGWFNTSKNEKETYLSFLVTGYGQGAREKAKIAAVGDVGLIRVSILEAEPFTERSTPRNGNETGFGPPVGGKVEAVRYEVMSEMDSIVVRYNRKK